jgi:hypothetical protein
VYVWLVVLHILGLIVLLMSHGMSMWVAFRIRGERDRATIGTLLALSSRGNQVMYLGLILLGIGGLGAAASAGTLTASWNVASYVVLAVVLVLMFAIAGSYYYPLRDGLVGTAKVARLDDDALAARLRTRRPEILAAVGWIGLTILVILMTIKPALW